MTILFKLKDSVVTFTLYSNPQFYYLIFLGITVQSLYSLPFLFPSNPSLCSICQFLLLFGRGITLASAYYMIKEILDVNHRININRNL